MSIPAPTSTSTTSTPGTSSSRTVRPPTSSAVLNAAKDFYHQLFDAHNSLSFERLHRMAVIAGVGQPTPFRLEHHSALRSAWVDLTKFTDTNRVAGNPHREGDGSVPLASAWLENLTKDHVRFFDAEHSALPNLQPVYDDVFRFLNDQSLTLPRTPKGALEQHLGAATPRALIPDLDGSATEPGPKGRWDDSLTLPKSEDEILRRPRRRPDPRIQSGKNPLSPTIA